MHEPWLVAAGPIAVSVGSSESVASVASASEGPALETVSVYTASLPAIIGLGSTVFTTVSAACRPTVVTTEALLFSPFGSPIGDVIAAPLLSEATCELEGTVAVIVTVRDSPTPSVPVTAHEIAAVGGSHVTPVPGTAEASTTPAGNVSVITTPVETDGPLLVAVMVHDTVWPASTLAGPVLVTDRSASWPLTTATVEMLLPSCGSSVGLVTCAVLLTSVASAASVPSTVIDTDASFVNVPSAQVRARVLASNEQPVPVKVTVDGSIVAGSTSTTVTFCAADGPMLVTPIKNRTGPPATGGTVGSTRFVMRTSADGATSVEDVALLSVASVGDETVAVLSSGEAVSVWSTATTRWICAGVPGARSPIAQVTRPAASEQSVVVEPTVTCADWYVVPAGIGSVTTTVRATDGPALATPIVHEAFVPGTIVARSDVLVMLSAALGVSVVLACAWLSVGSGSLVEEATVAVFVIDPATAFGSTVALIVIACVAATAIEPSSQRTVVPVTSQGVLPMNARAPISPAGSSSVTTTACATDGPSLATFTLHWMASPGAAAVGPDFVMRTSALVSTGVSVVEDRSVGVGSVVPDVTDAVLEMSSLT